MRASEDTERNGAHRLSFAVPPVDYRAVLDEPARRLDVLDDVQRRVAVLVRDVDLASCIRGRTSVGPYSLFKTQDAEH